MAGTVFRLDNKGTATLHPDAIKLCPEFKKLSSNDILYIILVYDYKSPFRQFDVEERKNRAKVRAYPKGLIKSPEARAKVREGVELYRSLQFDSRRETLDIYKSKIVQLNMSLRDVESDNTNQIRNITNSLNVIQGEMTKLERNIEYDDTMIELKGDEKLSEIENFQLNRSEYLRRWSPESQSA